MELLVVTKRDYEDYQATKKVLSHTHYWQYTSAERTYSYQEKANSTINSLVKWKEYVLTTCPF